MAQYLIETYQAKLILVGRTALPDRATWAHHRSTDTALAKRLDRYLKIEATGGQFCYAAVDVCDHDGLQRVIAAAETRWGGELAGVIHLAGDGHLESHWQAMDSRSVVAEWVAYFDAMFRAKVYGTWTLYQLLKAYPQAVFIAFSSVNSLFGGATFSAYSAANSFLDCFSVYLRRHCQSHCFNWTMWDDVGMSHGNPEYARDVSRTMGYDIVSITQGLNAFRASLYQPHAQLIVGLNGDNSRLQGHIVAEASQQAQVLYGYVVCREAGTASALRQETRRHIARHDAFGTPVDCHLVPLPKIPATALGNLDHNDLQALGPQGGHAFVERVAPQTDLEKTIAAIWSELLQLDAVGIHDSFFELGGHSILLVQLHSKLQQALNRELTITDLFRYPSIHALAGYLGQTQATKPVMEDFHDRAAKQRAAQDRRRPLGQQRLHNFRSQPF